MITTIIVACDPNFLIGTADNKIPWNIPEDMKFFKETTLHHAVVMGRKTFESFPNKKPLRHRLNVVVSKTHTPQSDDDTLASDIPVYVKTLSEAFDIINVYKPAVNEDLYNKERFIIGGSQIYRLALQEGCVDKILMTRVRKAYEGNIYFPDPVTYGFKETAVIKEHPDFTVVQYTK